MANTSWPQDVFGRQLKPFILSSSVRSMREGDFICCHCSEQRERWSCRERRLGSLPQEWVSWEEIKVDFANDKFEISKKRSQASHGIDQSEVQRSGPGWRAQGAIAVPIISEAVTGNGITQGINVNRENEWPKD